MMLCFAFWNWINLFCLRQQPSVLISGSTIVKEAVCNGIDKVMVFHVTLLLKVSSLDSLMLSSAGHQQQQEQKVFLWDTEAPGNKPVLIKLNAEPLRHRPCSLLWNPEPRPRQIQSPHPPTLTPALMQEGPAFIQTKWVWAILLTSSAEMDSPFTSGAHPLFLLPSHCM